jgi:DHA1 family tetracycline resistance protein-like MFS transporter
VAALLWQLGHFVYPATWAFWAELAHGWTASQVGWSLAAAGLAMAIVQAGVTGKVIARVGEAKAVLIGMVVGGLSFLGYIFAQQDVVIYTIIFLSALQGLVWPSLNALLSRMTDASHQGALQGGMASISSIASIIGPLAMTQALAFGAERGEPGGAFLLAFALVLIALLIIVFGVVRKVRPVPEAA